MELIDIQQLFEQNNFKDAYTHVQQYVKLHPDDSDGHKLHEKIYKAIQAQNETKIADQINKITELINNKQFEEAINLGLKLKTFAPDNQNLLKLINQAYESFQQAKQQNAKSDWDQFSDQISQLTQQHQYAEALKILEAAFAKKPDARLQQLSSKVRDDLVTYKLESNRKNLAKINPEQAMHFLDELQKVSPKHPALPNLRRQYQEKLNQKNAISRKHYIKEAKRQIQVLYLQHKYEKSIQTCIELIKADPKNHTAKKFYTKNQKGMEVENHQIAYDKLKKYDEKLKGLSAEQVGAEYVKI
ncbi:hypothetical protein COV81_01625 [Candidatus Peregrinibacteria bacterium CG11_big_fil_rev_8_21_14_0_20_41_10]|nr:MAG: hypothetical protein COV81_01625 [Candidatus Peregrinibacteria bacterium CG11_big_fil_rev_8_21_14_0_20_41_10]